ncbi:hypothetical protein U1Q18_031162 [Sarracenia purpurea var. burkii]
MSGGCFLVGLGLVMDLLCFGVASGLGCYVDPAVVTVFWVLWFAVSLSHLLKLLAAFVFLRCSVGCVLWT